MRQRTIGGSFQLEGKGLHTGIYLHLAAHPAPAGTGMLIRRIDLEGQPTIAILAENVKDTLRGTVLRNEYLQVSTVEHAMASFYAAGIDNCIFEVDGPEFPILDGSARFFTESLERVGIVEQDAEKEFLVIDRELEFTTESGSIIKASPCDCFEVEVEIGFDSPVLPSQRAVLTNMNEFAENISHSRTFVFVREIEPLLNMNLIRGGDLQNAIVIYDREIPQESMNTLTEKLNQPAIDARQLGYVSGPLRFENEPARHKLMDVIGDLALTGMPIKGRIYAKYPGHKVNTEFAKYLRTTYTKH
jgi:UDP-3-O-[3-hydroxymyristoyl] N-acetylglucosamine deacetylase/3-hydroxyacyl-[acyl-carrier-protein] dehydratase